MKSLALYLACISSILYISMTPVHAAEQKTLFNTESMKFESGTGSERCREKCDRRSGPDVKSFLSEGWTIVRSSPKEVVGEQYWHVPCNTCLPHGCVCIGTEYVLQREGMSPKGEAAGSVSDVPGKDTMSVVQRPVAEASVNELDLLKKEIEVLKQENALLKQELETLRNQMR